MSKFAFLARPDPTQLMKHVEDLRSQLDGISKTGDLQLMAWKTGSEATQLADGRSAFSFQLWNEPVHLVHPGWIAYSQVTDQELPVVNQALILYYFITADGTKPENQWVSFGDLPSGRFYNQAFQGYTGAELARHFQNDFLRFESAARQSNGQQPAPDASLPGDRAFTFQTLPRLAVLVVYWQGDEDFPASAQVLFQNTVPHYLPTDVCAFVGSALTRRLIKLG